MTIIPVANEAEWHAIRLRHIGGSESAALMGCAEDYQQSPYALFQTKSGRIPAPDVEGQRIEAGKRLEGAIAEWIAFGEGWKIEQFKGYAECDAYPRMGCTPDFVILNHPDGIGGLQIKNVDRLIHKQKWTNGEPPMSILVQVQHEMHCTGHKFTYVGALIGGNDTVTYRVDYRPKIGAAIEKKVREFWDSVDAGKEPPTDGANTTGDAIAAMYPEAVPQKEIDFSQRNDFVEHWGNLKQARLEMKAAKAKEQAAANWVLSQVGDAELIRYAGKIVGTCKTVNRKGYTVEATSYRTLKTKDE